MRRPARLPTRSTDRRSNPASERKRHHPWRGPPRPARPAGRATLLRPFISDRGKIRSRRVTRLTVQQQCTVARAIKNAREMALLPYRFGKAGR
ncbi:30S ribosomal protein S18 [Streptacidiphilus albus]|uniref:30S ribosomal protein S18 n=1 Tax=Streptacidiphilus albus TaxID=105425 RepID=UPI0038B65AC8